MAVTRPSAPAPTVRVAQVRDERSNAPTSIERTVTRDAVATPTSTEAVSEGARAVASTPSMRPTIGATQVRAGAGANAAPGPVPSPSPGPAPVPPDDHVVRVDKSSAPSQLGPSPDTPKAPLVRPPTAFDSASARSNAAPAGTTAKELDAAVPRNQRDAAIKAQVEAHADARTQARSARTFGEDPGTLERAVLNAFYAARDTYVDPDTKTVYAASYDRTTGELTLTRNDEPTATVPSPPSQLNAPLGTKDDEYAAAATEAATDGATAEATTSPKEFVGRGRMNIDPDIESPPTPHVQDTSIVVAPSGAREVTVNTAIKNAPDAAGMDLATRLVTRLDASGTELSTRSLIEQTRLVDDGVVLDRYATSKQGTRTETSWERHQVNTAGDRTVRRGARIIDGDEVVSDHRTTLAEAGGVVLRDSAVTTFDGKDPRSTLIERSATVDGRTKSSRYVVGFDDEQVATSVKGEPGSGREHLDAWVADRLGRLAEGERRPAFGIVTDGSARFIDLGRVRGPAYVSEIGVRTTLQGVDVFVERDSIPASDTLQASLDAVVTSWEGMPPKMHGAAKQIDLMVGRGFDDREQSARFGKEFTSGASAGGDGMSYWLDNDPSKDTTRHEYGHLTGKRGGPPSGRAWQRAMESDLKTGLRAKLGALDDDDVRFITGDKPLLTDELGVSSYAEMNLEADGNRNEDWCESIAMLLGSREQGGVLEVTKPDGAKETYTFEELFPARTKLLKEHYGL